MMKQTSVNMRAAMIGKAPQYELTVAFNEYDDVADLRTLFKAIADYASDKERELANLMNNKKEEN